MHPCQSDRRIGPQQQHEPHERLGEKCALTYPLNPACPTQGCATFRRITLRNITVTRPWLSSVVLLGNSTNPMTDIVFDGVNVVDPGAFPFPDYHCESVTGWARRSSPMPSCLAPRP